MQAPGLEQGIQSTMSSSPVISHAYPPLGYNLHVFSGMHVSKSSSSLVLLMGAAKRASTISAQVWNDPEFTAQLTWLQSSQTPLY